MPDDLVGPFADFLEFLSQVKMDIVGFCVFQIYAIDKQSFYFIGFMQQFLFQWI